MSDVVHADALAAIAQLAQANAQLDSYRKALEYVISARDRLSCRCGSPDFHQDNCPIGVAINTLAEH